MNEAPVVEVYSVASTGVAHGGGRAFGAAESRRRWCNAIYAATKKRIRALPVVS